MLSGKYNIILSVTFHFIHNIRVYTYYSNSEQDTTITTDNVKYMFIHYVYTEGLYYNGPVIVYGDFRRIHKFDIDRFFFFNSIVDDNCLTIVFTMIL